MATVEVFHKAAGVCNSSKITDSFVASFPGLPHIIAFNSVYTHGTFETNSASLGHLSRSGKGFSGVHRFSATIAVRLYSSLDECKTLWGEPEVNRIGAHAQKGF